jgi:hypothetical protein
MVAYLSLEEFLLAGHHDRWHIRESWCCSPVLPERREVDLLQVLLPLRDGRQVGGLEHHCRCHGQSHARTPRLRAQGRQLLHGQGMHRCVNSGCNRVWCSSSSRAPCCSADGCTRELRAGCGNTRNVCGTEYSDRGHQQAWVWSFFRPNTSSAAHGLHVTRCHCGRTWDCGHAACFLWCGNTSLSHWTRLQLGAAADRKRAALPCWTLLCCPAPRLLSTFMHTSAQGTWTI